tara:strand:- start:30 stop:464 length:435 start_codon:yes stop_codon:yes gene_type:complete
MSTKEFEEIVSDFEILEDWDDRYRYIIDLGKKNVGLEENKKNDTTKVNGCASQVWLFHEIKKINNKNIFYLRGDSDAMIVKGLVAVLIKLYNDIEVNKAVKIDAISQFKRLDLSEHLSSQRSNGLNSMIKLIKAILINNTNVKC